MLLAASFVAVDVDVVISTLCMLHSFGSCCLHVLFAYFLVIDCLFVGLFVCLLMCFLLGVCLLACLFLRLIGYVLGRLGACLLGWLVRGGWSGGVSQNKACKWACSCGCKQADGKYSETGQKTHHENMAYVARRCCS